MAVDLSLPNRDPTDHPQQREMENHGGSTLAAIQVWTVVWNGDTALGEAVDGLNAWMVTSDGYWLDSLSEYGVGKGSAKGVLVLPGAAPTTFDDSAVAPLLESHIA